MGMGMKWDLLIMKYVVLKIVRIWFMHTVGLKSFYGIKFELVIIFKLVPWHIEIIFIGHKCS